MSILILKKNKLDDYSPANKDYDLTLGVLWCLLSDIGSDGSWLTDALKNRGPNLGTNLCYLQKQGNIVTIGYSYSDETLEIRLETNDLIQIIEEYAMFYSNDFDEIIIKHLNGKVTLEGKNIHEIDSATAILKRTDYGYLLINETNDAGLLLILSLLSDVYCDGSWLKEGIINNEFYGTNQCLLEKKSETIIIKDALTTIFQPVIHEFELNTNHLLEIIEKWESLCNKNVDEIIVTRTGNKFDLSSC